MNKKDINDMVDRLMEKHKDAIDKLSKTDTNVFTSKLEGALIKLSKNNIPVSIENLINEIRSSENSLLYDLDSEIKKFTDRNKNRIF